MDALRSSTPRKTFSAEYPWPWQRAAGPILTIVLASILELLSHTVFRIPNPPAILLLAVVLSAFVGGLASGLCSAALAWIYFAYFFSEPGAPFTYTDENLRQIIVWAFATPAVALICGRLKRRVLRLSMDAVAREIAQCDTLQTELLKRGFAESQLRRAQTELESRVAARTAELTGANESLQAEIAARKGFERSLRYTEARKSAIVESALDCIISMDLTGRIIEFNPAAERTFGYRREDVIGKPLAEVIIPPASRERHRKGMARYLATGEAPIIGKRIEMNALRADGSEIPVELSVVAIHTNGDPVFTGFMRDISERIKAEKERAQLLEAEKSARLQAEETNRLKDEFLATISHELRTPLTALMGWVGLFRAGKLDEPRKIRALEIIDKTAHAEAAIVEQLLDVSGIIAGRVRVELRPMHLRPVLQRATEAVRPAAEGRRIALKTHLETRQEMVRGDEHRLDQVVANLLANALKFTPDGGRIDVSLASVGGLLKLTVTDTGVGIATGFLPHMFERFRQADNSSTRQYGGLGLGLNLVQHLVEAHHGSVQISSPGIGKGTTVTVLLPSYVEPVPSGSQHALARRADAPAALNGLRVLVVEDDAETSEMLVAALRSFGAEVQSAASVPEAWDALHYLKPDVLVADIGMPGEDGYSLLRKLRAQSAEEGGKIPAIALTAYTKAEDRAEALAAGFNLHVAKPVKPERLSEAVATLAQDAALN